MRNAKTRRLRNNTKEKRKTEKGVTVREVKFGYASLPRKKLEIKEISGIKEILV